jgi:hypothetical protein
MRTAVRLAWRGAAMVAFGATAALAITLGRPGTAPAALTTTVHQQPVHACAVAGPLVRAPTPGVAHGRCGRAGTVHPGPAVRGHLQPARTRAHHHAVATPADTARPE